MSASWHRNRRTISARSQGAFGFFDSAYQIALFPDHQIAPHVVIDHELTHVNLVNNSSLGLLERVLVFLEWSSHLNGNSDAAINAKTLLSVVLEATEIVHEAVAWFGTELQSYGHENLQSPDVYKDDVTRVRSLFERMPGKPFGQVSDDLPTVLSIADEIATYSLNSPLMAELWSRPELISTDLLRIALRRKVNNPLARFRRICSRLDGVPFSEVAAWSRAMNDPSIPASQDQRRLLPTNRSKVFLFGRRYDTPAVFRSDLLLSDTVRAIRSLATHIGLFNSTPVKLLSDVPSSVQPDDDAILEAWTLFKITHGFDPKLDRYSQVCVLQTSLPRIHRELVLDDHPNLVAGTMNASRYLVATLKRFDSSAEFAHVYDKPSQVILTGSSVDISADGYLLDPTWYVDFATARSFLKEYAKAKPVLASSVGYNFGEGDIHGADLLVDVPHVVVAIRDFRSLWLGLGGKKGLRGCRSIEWRPMPSPSGRKHFGFLLFKPADAAFPIVVNPCVVSQYERAVTAADRLPSAHGVELIESRGDPYQWLGAMTPHVMTAASIFEVGDREDAASISNLLQLPGNLERLSPAVIEQLLCQVAATQLSDGAL